MKPTVIILAAGLGTRMKSEYPKVLHELAGKPLILHVLDVVKRIDPRQIVVVLGYQAERVRAVMHDYECTTVIQEKQLGTGHAVRQAESAISASEGPVIVLCADTPLITPNTLLQLLKIHQNKRTAVTVLTATVEHPFGYGRIVRNKTGVARIVEEKDATSTQRNIHEINTGIYCFEKAFLLSALAKITNTNAQGEYYLTDAISLARKKKLIVSAVACPNQEEVLGINSRVDLGIAEKIFRKRINQKWLMQGVTMHNPETVFIGESVFLGKDTVLSDGVRLEGNTRIGDRCTILSGTRILNSTISSEVLIKDHCVIEESDIAEQCSVGPFAHLRPGTTLKAGARIGNFVEIKKSTVGEKSKANHLTYIGDAVVGKNVNIGAGVITCNYDGFGKYQTVIEDDVFVGSDAQLVAPVRVGQGSLVAAGSTITKDVPADALAISRIPQENLDGVAARRRNKKQKM